MFSVFSSRWWMERRVLRSLQFPRDVKIEIVDGPRAIDFARGISRSHVGYFWGTRLVDDRDRRALPPAGGPVGEIVIFRKNLHPYTEEILRGVIRHELAHAAGLDEFEIVHILGLDPMRGCAA